MLTRVLLLALGMSMPLVTLAGGDDLVIVKINGKEAQDLTLHLFQKPGGYKAPPKVAFKRAKIQELAITAPVAGLDGPTDSLDVKVTGYAGSVGFFKVNQHVAPGGTATFAVAEAAAQDFTPNGKQQTQVGRFEVEVIPIKRAGVKGSYKGLISLD
jgi:hypothetical protein